MTDYPLLLRRLRALTDGVPHRTAKLANASALLFETLEEINWAGLEAFAAAIEEMWRQTEGNA